MVMLLAEDLMVEGSDPTRSREFFFQPSFSQVNGIYATSRCITTLSVIKCTFKAFDLSLPMCLLSTTTVAPSTKSRHFSVALHCGTSVQHFGAALQCQDKKKRLHTGHKVNYSLIFHTVSPAVEIRLHPHGPVNLGDRVILQCVSTGIPAPSITWFKDEIEQNSSIDRLRLISESSWAIPVLNEGEEQVLQVNRNITLNNSRDEDSATYECRANNDASPGENMISFNLSVQSEFSINK